METCRTCAKCDFENGNDWLDLFHPLRWADEIANVRIELNNWKLKITPNDGLPQKICTDCFTKFCDVYAFRTECQQAQIKLSNIFDKIEEQSMGSEVDTITDGIESQCAQNDPANSENTLLKLFNISSPNLLNASINEFDALEQSCGTKIQDQAIKSVSSVGLPEKTIAAIVSASASLSSTSLSLSLPSLPIPIPNTADNDNNNLNETLNDIQSDINSNQFSDDEIHFNDLIEEIENENENDGDEDADDMETFPSISMDNLTSIKIDESTKKADESKCDFSVTFECKYCYRAKDAPPQAFESQRLLLVHITNKHNMELPFTCPHCQLGFRDAASRTVHIKDKHVEKHHVCDVCGKKYADRCNLRHHIEKFHSENDFECTRCEKRFYSRKSLKYHMKWHDPELQLKCNYCDRLFINQRHLQCHEATHTGLRNTEYCSFCGKSFIHLKTLRWHIFRKHGGEKPYKCSNCTEAFTSYREKRIHMLEYHLENLTTLEKSECMLCHKHFESENELKHHMTEGHKPKQAALIITNNKRVLQNKRRKSFNGIFQCEVCSQRFNMKTALERHMNVHSVEGRPHACPQCSKRFKRIQDMNWHMKTHSNDKANICDVCGKGFALKYVLTQHKRSHEVLEKNFKCSICGRAYLFEKSLRVHERIHTGKTYYKCDLCSESFVTHIKLRYHMGKKHRSAEDIELPLDELVNIVIPGN